MSSPIDLSRLSAPSLVTVDYDAIRAERVADLQARLEAAGISWEVGNLHANPFAIVQEADAFRETLDKQAINDMAVARTIGFAQGTDLDWIAATFYGDLGLQRMDGELDDRFERRILLAAEGLAGALTRGGIAYHALTADIRVIDAVAYQTRPGQVAAHILADADVETDVLRVVRDRFRDPKLNGSGELVLSLAKRHVTPVSILMQHGTGPAPEVLRTEAAARLDVVRDRLLTRIGEPLTTDELIAEGRVSGVSKFLLESPVADVDPGMASVLDLDISIRTERVA